MRFMILVKATQDSEAGVMPRETLIARMAEFHEELARAGALVDASGLQATSKGWKIHFPSGRGGTPIVIDGPFPFSRDLVAGYTIIKVNSAAEALTWSRRFPNPAGDGVEAEVEVRRLFELDDFGPSEAIDRFRDLELGGEG